MEDGWKAALAVLGIVLGAGAILMTPGDSPTGITQWAVNVISQVVFWGGVLALALLALQAAHGRGWVSATSPWVRVVGLAALAVGAAALFFSVIRPITRDGGGSPPGTTQPSHKPLEAAVRYANWAWPRFVSKAGDLPGIYIVLNEIVLDNDTDETMILELSVSLPEADTEALGLRDSGIPAWTAGLWVSGFLEANRLGEHNRIGSTVTLEPRQEVQGWAWVRVSGDLLANTSFGRALAAARSGSPLLGLDGLTVTEGLSIPDYTPEPPTIEFSPEVQRMIDQALDDSVEVSPFVPYQAARWIEGIRLVVQQRHESTEALTALVQVNPHEWVNHHGY